MKKRVLNPDHDHFHLYGGRGITIDPRWLEGFEQFYKDMGPRPSSNHSLERVNNQQGYGPDNCIWATLDVQANNTRRNVHVTYEGEEMTLAQAARKAGLAYNTVWQRKNDGLPPEEWFLPPKRPRTN